MQYTTPATRQFWTAHLVYDQYPLTVVTKIKSVASFFKAYPIQNRTRQFFHNFLSNLADNKTNRQTNKPRQTDNLHGKGLQYSILRKYADRTLCLWSCSQTRWINSFRSSSMCGSMEPDVSMRKIHDFSTTVPNTRLLPECIVIKKLLINYFNQTIDQSAA